MRSKRRNLIDKIAAISAVAGIFVVALLWVTVRPPLEPVYQGEKMSVWMDRYVDGSRHYDRRSNPEFLEAEAAIRAIGTNGIPALLDWLREPESGLKQKLWNLLKKQSLIKMQFPNTLVLRRNAGKTFRALGADASNAVPALMQIYRDSKTDETRTCCLEAIIAIGPAAAAAAPILLKESSDTNALSYLRFVSISGLRDIRPPPETVVPVMITLLNDKDGGVRYNAIEVLGTYGPAAKSAAPALVQFMKTNTETRPSLNLQSVAAKALWEIDPEAAAKAGVK